MRARVVDTAGMGEGVALGRVARTVVLVVVLDRRVVVGVGRVVDVVVVVVVGAVTNTDTTVGLDRLTCVTVVDATVTGSSVSSLSTTDSSVTKGSDPDPASKQSSSSHGRSTLTTLCVGLGLGGWIGRLYTGVIKSSRKKHKYTVTLSNYN